MGLKNDWEQWGFLCMLRSHSAMSDALLTACAKALPIAVLEHIYRMYIRRSVLEHPYITKEIHQLHKEVSIKRFQRSIFNRRCDEFYFFGTGVILSTNYYMQDKDKIEIIRLHSKTVYILIPMDERTVYIDWEPMYWSRIEETGTLLEEKKRRELAKVIVLLHRVYPNLITRNTRILIGNPNLITRNTRILIGSVPGFKTKTRSVLLYDVFHPPFKTLSPIPRSSFCTMM